MVEAVQEGPLSPVFWERDFCGRCLCTLCGVSTQYHPHLTRNYHGDSLRQGSLGDAAGTPASKLDNATHGELSIVVVGHGGVEQATLCYPYRAARISGRWRGSVGAA